MLSRITQVNRSPFFSKNLLTELVDGFRIDAAKHVAKPFWQQFQPKANVYTVGEVLDTDATTACVYMSQALSGILNYPMFVIPADPVPSITLLLINQPGGHQ
jgi:hypothetical protein